MRIKSFPKINLSLRVIKKLNGLHDIETNSALIKIFDEIDIKRIKKTKLSLKVNLKRELIIRKTLS